jgi:NifB/MoaA-like Fe-S oxidoreductase
LIGKLNTKFSASLSVVAVPNGYFGGDVSVAGLLTGQDLVAARHELRGDFVLLPRQMIKSDEPVMLDGMTLAEVQARLDKPVRAVNLKELSAFLLGCSTN